MVIEEWTIIFLRGGWAIFLGTFFFCDSKNNTNDKPAYSCQAFSRTFVHLDKPLQKVPAKKKQFKKLQKLAG